jgi:hypothetical protein
MPPPPPPPPRQFARCCVRGAGDAPVAGGGNSPEGGLAGAGLAVASSAARRAHVALRWEAVARGVHLLEIGLRAGLVGLLARGLALELVVVLETHRGSRSRSVEDKSWERVSPTRYDREAK